MRTPAALPSIVAAVARPPPAPCTSTVVFGVASATTNSARYAVSQAVERQAACSSESASGFATRLRVGTATHSASVPSCQSESIVTRGSKTSSPAQAGSLTSAWTTTSRPDSSTPAASEPSTRGKGAPLSPITPRKESRSWWLIDAARTVTSDQPSSGSGCGCSPTSRTESGSAASVPVIRAASISDAAAGALR